jgi:ABC-type amino acid transport substrate-binding protein
LGIPLKALRRFWIAGIFGLWASSAAVAEPLNLDIMELAPYGIKQPADGRHGIFADIFDALATRTGLDYRIGIFTVKRVIKQMSRKQTDCSIFLETPYFIQNHVRIGAIGWQVESVIYATRKHPLNRYEDIYGLKVAVPRGAQFGHRFDQDDRINRFLTDTYNRSVILLKNERVDAMIGTRPSLDYLIARENFSPDNLSKPLILHSKGINVFCRHGVFDKKTADRLALALKSMRESGEITKIIRSYLGG